VRPSCCLRLVTFSLASHSAVRIAAAERISSFLLEEHKTIKLDRRLPYDPA